MTDEQKQEAEIVQVGLDSLAFIDRTIYCNEDNPAIPGRIRFDFTVA